MRTMAAMGAELVRVDLRWDLVARRRPARPRDPGDPAYEWRHYDRVVDAARAEGLRVLAAIWGTPAWAADPEVPPSDRFPPWATRPSDPGDLGRFAAAAARRYAPRVRLWEAWNEPNLPLFLRPQYARRGGRLEAVSPRDYSRMLRSVYREVKRVDPGARVGGGVTAPAGDRCPLRCPTGPDDRVAPLDFARGLAAPGNRPPMDAYSHHPYPLTPPRRETARAASYVDLYNLGRLRRLLGGTYLAGRPLWLSEIGFATAPTREYPLSFGEAEQARLLADAHRRLREVPGVELVTWYPLQDGRAWRSGLLRADGSEKPAADAYRLPAAPEDPDARDPWAPAAVVGQVRAADGPVEVALERRAVGRWLRVSRAATTADGTFRAVAPPPVRGVYRIVSEGPPRRVGRPLRLGPRP